METQKVKISETQNEDAILTAGNVAGEQPVTSAASRPVKVEKINIVQPTPVVGPHPLELKAKVYPTNAANKKLSWKSSDPMTFFITDGYGLPMSIGGYATVTATATDGSGVSDSCVVQILDKPIQFVSVSPCKSVIRVGKTDLMTATLCPEDAAYPCITWKSTNSDVATVNESGLVMGVSPGIAMIVATAKDGTRISDYCHVSVGAREISPECIRMIKGFEGPSYSPQKVGDCWYIGYGHRIFGDGNTITIDGVEYTSIDEEMATRLMYDDITQVFMPALDRFLKKNDIFLNEHQYEACISYSYSTGWAIWDSPDRKIVRFLKAKSNFDNCDMVYAALFNNEHKKRRQHEAELFVYGTYYY